MQLLHQRRKLLLLLPHDKLRHDQERRVFLELPALLLCLLLFEVLKLLLLPQARYRDQM